MQAYYQNDNSNSFFLLLALLVVGHGDTVRPSSHIIRVTGTPLESTFVVTDTNI